MNKLFRQSKANLLPKESTPLERLKLTRRRSSIGSRGQFFPQQERRTYSSLSKEESKSALQVYKKIRTFLAKDKDYFSREQNHHVKILVSTVLGEALIENVIGLRSEDYHTGGNNWGVLRVSLGNKMMFVKIEDMKSAKNRVLGTRVIESFLKKHGGKFEGIKFVCASVHVAHDFLFEKCNRTIYATDFYPKSDFVMVENFSSSARMEKIAQAISSLRHEIGEKYKQHSVGEICNENAIYNSKTKTVVLFDLHFSPNNVINIPF